MKKYLIIILLVISVASVFSGNPDRVGQSGATELTINPWARSSGWVGCNTSGISGVEAMMFNPAGIVGIPNSEFLFSRVSWLSGTDIFINSFGFSQKIGAAQSSALGLSIMSFDFGRIEITTENQPEGGIGTFSPSFVNIGLSYAYMFSSRIRAGLTTRIISESITDAKAIGVCFDAGLQYITDFGGDEDLQRTKFGISLRNVGTPMKFSGDGLVKRGTFEGGEYSQSLDGRSAAFELPTMVNIGLTQDFYLDAKQFHRLTFGANFTSNSFTNDQYNIGLEYSLKNIVMLRSGYLFEKGITKKETRQNVYTGPAAGFSVNIPFGENKDKMFAVDYSFRATDYFGGTHSFGARIVL